MGGDKKDKDKKDKDKKDKHKKDKDKKDKGDKKAKKEVKNETNGESFVIFFPDEKMPCRNGSSCTRKQCDFAHEPTGLSRMLDVLNSAKKTLDICVFTITADEIANTILSIHSSGVKVRIITDDEQRVSLGSDIQKFVDAGIVVKDDNSKFHMHHKFAIIDNKTLVNGSLNWTRQAVLNNRENIVVTSDSALVKSFSREFQAMWDLY